MLDKRDAVATPEPMHPRCAFEEMGDGILMLPAAERGKFAICDVPARTMQRLLEVG